MKLDQVFDQWTPMSTEVDMARHGVDIDRGLLHGLCMRRGVARGHGTEPVVRPVSDERLDLRVGIERRRAVRQDLVDHRRVADR